MPRTLCFDTERCWSQEASYTAIGFEIRSSLDLSSALIFVEVDIFPVLVPITYGC